MAKGKIIYYPDGVTPTTYNFDRNYAYGDQSIRLDFVSRKRALDGTAYTNIASLKGGWILNFEYVSLAQYQAFLAAYDSGFSFELYLDSAAAKTADVIFSSSPTKESQAILVNGNVTYNFTAELEEI